MSENPYQSPQEHTPPAKNPVVAFLGTIFSVLSGLALNLLGLILVASVLFAVILAIFGLILTFSQK